MSLSVVVMDLFSHWDEVIDWVGQQIRNGKAQPRMRIFMSELRRGGRYRGACGCLDIIGRSLTGSGRQSHAWRRRVWTAATSQDDQQQTNQSSGKTHLLSLPPLPPVGGAPSALFTCIDTDPQQRPRRTADMTTIPEALQLPMYLRPLGE